MNRIVVDSLLKVQLAGFSEPVELVDDVGNRLGHFVPTVARPASDECPYSGEELERMRSEKGGRPLREIWRSLGAK
jgi:hypothetical protein